MVLSRDRRDAILAAIVTHTVLEKRTLVRALLKAGHHRGMLQHS